MMMMGTRRPRREARRRKEEIKMDGYANWLDDQISSLKSRDEYEEWDEYLTGRRSGFESALNRYKEYRRMMDGGD